VIVSFENSLEADDWDDGTGWMGSLMSLRSELLRGDIRCLYLGWLLCAQNEEVAEDDLEPAVWLRKGSNRTKRPAGPRLRVIFTPTMR
jgi:hypothetical protein